MQLLHLLVRVFMCTKGLIFDKDCFFEYYSLVTSERKNMNKRVGFSFFFLFVNLAPMMTNTGYSPVLSFCHWLYLCRFPYSNFPLSRQVAAALTWHCFIQIISCEN